MAVIIRKRSGFVSGTITNNPLAIGGTTMNSANLAAMPEVASPDIAAIVLDPAGGAGAPEIVWVTAHTAAATSATIARGKEGSTARQHANTTAWVHMPTLYDHLPPIGTEDYVLTVQNSGESLGQYGSPAWEAIPDKIYRVGHTWTIGGTLAVASGDTDFINPFFVDLITGQTVAVAGYKAVINSGTNVVLDVKKNGTTMTGFDDLTITTTASTAFPGNISVSDGDYISLVVVSVSGTPKNLAFTLFLEYTQ